jgi:hypothetical protein
MNRKISFDFHIPRYFAQRFPPLYDSTGEGASNYGDNEPNAVFRWPAGWAGGDDIARLAHEKAPPRQFGENATVLDAISDLNCWLLEKLQRLKEPVKSELGKWLRDQWRRYTNRELPADDECLCSYLSLLSDGGHDINGRRYCIPPLIGYLEVCAYRPCLVDNGDETQVEASWQNEDRDPPG